MKFLQLKSSTLLNDKETGSLAGQRLTSEHYSEVITENCIVQVDGEVKACLIKAAFSPEKYASLLPAYIVALKKDGDLTNRGSVIGPGASMPILKKDGTLSSRQRVPKSVRDAHVGKGNNFGHFRYLDTEAGHIQFGLSGFTRSNQQLYIESLPLFYEVGEIHKAWLPEQYNAQLEQVNLIAEELRLGLLPYTSFTLNYNNRTRAHTDSGNMSGSLGAMATMGDAEGGLTIFPRLRLALDVQPGDVLFADFKDELHGNSAIIGDRISIVHYARRDLLLAFP